MMLSHYHGQILNYSEIGRSLRLSDPTIKSYLDILEGSFMVRVLRPWFENISKRQVKRPKVYLRDAGLLHFLLGIHSKNALLSHPKLRASWEGFALEETLRAFDHPMHAYFWATQGGAELDLLILHQDKRYGFEFKFGDKLQITASMKIAMSELKLEKLFVVYPGQNRFNLDEKVVALPLDDLAKGIPI